MCVREGEVGRDALRACDRPFDVSQKSLTDLAFFSGGGGRDIFQNLTNFSQIFSFEISGEGGRLTIIRTETVLPW